MTIQVTGIEALGHHGLSEIERKAPQPFIIDIRIWLSPSAFLNSHHIHDTVDYSEISRIVLAAVADSSYPLIESLAYHIGDQLLVRFPISKRIRIRIQKPHAPMPRNYGIPAVIVTIKPKKPL